MDRLEPAVQASSRAAVAEVENPWSGPQLDPRLVSCEKLSSRQLGAIRPVLLRLRVLDVARLIGSRGMTKPPANVLALPTRRAAEMALKAAVEKVIVEHARQGLPMYIWRDGTVGETPPPSNFRRKRQFTRGSEQEVFVLSELLAGCSSPLQNQSLIPTFPFEVQVSHRRTGETGRNMVLLSTPKRKFPLRRFLCQVQNRRRRPSHRGWKAHPRKRCRHQRDKAIQAWCCVAIASGLIHSGLPASAQRQREVHHEHADSSLARQGKHHQ